MLKPTFQETSATFSLLFKWKVAYVVEVVHIQFPGQLSRLRS